MFEVWELRRDQGRPVPKITHSADGWDPPRNREGAGEQPGRLTGEQLRFLRKHLGLTEDQQGGYIHTDKTKTSKWEGGEDRIGPANDRLIRLVAAALNKEMRPAASAIAEHLSRISDDTGTSWELHVDAVTLRTTFIATPKAG